MVVDPTWPVMRDANVHGPTQVLHAPHVQHAHMVDTAFRVLGVGRGFVASLGVVVVLEDPRDSGNAETVDVDDTRVAHVVNVLGHPTAVGEFLEKGGRLVIATDEDGQDGGDLFPAVVSGRGMERDW